VDLANFDDIVSDKQLTAGRTASAEMHSIGHWFKASVPTLLRSQEQSRVVLAATRYDLEDPYEDIMLDARSREGDWSGLDGYYPQKADGEWNVYYRSALVDGQSIMPSAYTAQMLQKLAKTDHWTYVTQYINNPHAVDSQEFGSYDLRRCFMEYDDIKQEYFIRRDDTLLVQLSTCDVVGGCDPAASEKRVSHQTSRSAVAIVARDAQDNIYIIDGRRDYVDPVTMMDWLFQLKRRFQREMRIFRLEAQGAFKLLVSVIRREEQLRQTDLNLLPIPSMGDKLATIRLIWEPYLKRRAIFVCDNMFDIVASEFNVFPSQMLDMMDAVKIAIAGTHSVARDADDEYYDDEDDDFDGRTTSAFSQRHKSAAGY